MTQDEAHKTAKAQSNEVYYAVHDLLRHGRYHEADRLMEAIRDAIARWELRTGRYACHTDGRGE